MYLFFLCSARLPSMSGLRGADFQPEEANRAVIIFGLICLYIISYTLYLYYKQRKQKGLNK